MEQISQASCQCTSPTYRNGRWSEKNLAVGQATTNLLKSISAGKILSLTDINGISFRLETK